MSILEAKQCNQLQDYRALLFNDRSCYDVTDVPGLSLPPLNYQFPRWSRTALLLDVSQTRQNEIKKSSPEGSGSGFIIGGVEPATRVAHLEHSVRFLQEQHRLMLSGLHAEIEALRERNRDLQFQLIFNKDISPKISPANDEIVETTEETRLKLEVSRLEREATVARNETRVAEDRVHHLQRMVDAHATELRELQLRKSTCESCADVAGGESRAELRARLLEAERLVRRLRGEHERRRREVQGGAEGVTNLLFDGAAARAAHVACMKNSLQAQLRAGSLDLGFHNNYQFPPLPTHDFYRPQELCGAAVGPRRPLTLPDLAHAHASTVYVNHHTRQRGHYDRKKQANVENISPKTPEDSNGPLLSNEYQSRVEQYPELNVVVTKILPELHTVAKVRNRPRRARYPRAPPDL